MRNFSYTYSDYYVEFNEEGFVDTSILKQLLSTIGNKKLENEFKKIEDLDSIIDKCNSFDVDLGYVRWLETYKKDIGTQYGQSGNKDLLVITYKFTATQDNVKPFKIWKKYIYATQEGRNLSDGMLRLADSDNPSAKEDVEKMNNSVSFLKTGESREIIQVYFIDKNKEIDLNYPKYTENIKL